MQLLMTSVESLQQETYRLLGYEKNLAKQVQTKQLFIQRRASQTRQQNYLICNMIVLCYCRKKRMSGELSGEKHLYL